MSSSSMLKALAGRLNRDTLDVWQQMTAFVRQEDIRDPARVNAECRTMGRRRPRRLPTNRG